MYTWSYGAPLNGLLNGFHSGYITYEWSYFTLLITGHGAHVVIAIVFVVGLIYLIFLKMVAPIYVDRHDTDGTCRFVRCCVSRYLIK